MLSGLLGKKIGMTQIFDKDGNSIPVTVVEVGPCYILELKETPKKVKLGFESVKESLLKRPALGYFKKLGMTPLRYIREFSSKDNKEYKVGQMITSELFKPGDFVNVSGTSIGKGFQGGVKRWHWAGGPTSHGSMSHRRVGSIGSSADPSRTFKGHHMPGHLGDSRVTIQNLRVMHLDVNQNLILLKGAVPGKRNALLSITLSRKKAWKSLEEKKAASAVRTNPMKQSKVKATGKGK